MDHSELAADVDRTSNGHWSATLIDDMRIVFRRTKTASNGAVKRRKRAAPPQEQENHHRQRGSGQMVKEEQPAGGGRFHLLSSLQGSHGLLILDWRTNTDTTWTSASVGRRAYHCGPDVTEAPIPGVGWNAASVCWTRWGVSTLQAAQTRSAGFTQRGLPLGGSVMGLFRPGCEVFRQSRSRHQRVFGGPDQTFVPRNIHREYRQY